MLRPSLTPLALVAFALLAVPACEKTTAPGDSSAGLGDDGKVSPTPPKPEPEPEPEPEPRSRVVPEDHPLYGRYEGDGFPNDCTADTDCHIGGCGSEVCTAQEGVISTCDIPPAPLPPGSSCGCVASQCRWWSADGATLSEPEPPGEPASGDCGGEICKPPASCMEYYGIAGPRGPKLHSCEIPCRPEKGGCPDGMKCTTIADGPGSVCR